MYPVYKSIFKEQMRKKRKSNYDIDHIVIPYSMASSTRVEKPKYKVADRYSIGKGEVRSRFH